MARPTLGKSRTEAEVFADLQALCVLPGYIHAVAYFCWRDNLIRFDGSQLSAQDLEHQHSHEKLLRTEIATLIGLMIRSEFDLGLPEANDLQSYLDRTESLLDEVHKAMTKPWLGKWGTTVGQIPIDPFSDAAAFREPIFYCGESAYNFQYRDLARLKYRADDVWLLRNKGFDIDDACQLGEAIGELQTRRQIECAEFMATQHPDRWTLLPGFTFTPSEVAEASGVAQERVASFLSAFSCTPSERNDSFTALNEFNVTNAAPIIKTAQGSYILFQHYSLLEAIYESPFYWMLEDKTYRAAALTNRGQFTEDFVTDRLEAVFDASRVFRNVDIYSGLRKPMRSFSLAIVQSWCRRNQNV
jgi:hypothetical protein